MTDKSKRTAKCTLLQSLEELLYKKPFSKISVNELCEHAKVSRTAFYTYYEDKYQLFSCCLDEKHKSLDQLKQAHPPKEFLILMLDFIQSEEKFFFNAFGSSDDDELREITYQFFYQEFSDVLSEKMQAGITFSGPTEIISAFYIGGLTTAIIRWIKGNYRFSKEELAACLYDLLKDFV